MLVEDGIDVIEQALRIAEENILHRNYMLWDTEHIVIDTAGQTVEQSAAALQRMLDNK